MTGHLIQLILDLNQLILDLNHKLLAKLFKPISSVFHTRANIDCTNLYYAALIN